MRKVKLVVIVVISILTLVILLQNTEPVQARVLVTVQMSLALLMMLTFVLGFIVGILVPTYFLRKTDGKAKPGTGPSR